MKLNFRQGAVKAALFAIVVLAGCLSAGAQAGIRGTFTLPQEMRWGQARLPAGDYKLSIGDDSTPATVVIQDAKGGRTVATVVFQTQEDSRSDGSALLVDTQGGQRVIYSLRMAELGVVFISDPALAHRVRARDEENRTQVVPVAIAKK